jgi:putative copper export protein
LSWPDPFDIVLVAFRWLEYAGLIGFIGVVVVRRLAGMTPALHWARPSMVPALVAALIGGFGVVVTEAARDWRIDGAAVTVVAAEGVALLLCLFVRRWVVPPAIFAAMALPFGGHAAGLNPAFGAIFPDSAGAISMDALHILSAGAWAGGILVLATLFPPGGWGGAEGRAMLERFGRIAFVAFAITALTGVLRATAGLRDLSDLWTTEYGLVLSAKTAGVLVMVAMSALVFRRGSPHARYEALVVLLVLAATAVLAVSQVPH